MGTEAANHAMDVLLERTAALESSSLDAELATYVADGLAIESDGSIVSVAAARLAHAERWRFSDRVQYEAFANKVHLDDWMSERHDSARLEEKLAQALLLADAVGKLAEQSGVTVAVIISADTSTTDVVFRFHGVRPGEVPWLADIEQYKEAVLARIYGAHN